MMAMAFIKFMFVVFLLVGFLSLILSILEYFGEHITPFHKKYTFGACAVSWLMVISLALASGA
jgi:hypothetical protein